MTLDILQINVCAVYTENIFVDQLNLNTVIQFGIDRFQLIIKKQTYMAVEQHISMSHIYLSNVYLKFQKCTQITQIIDLKRILKVLRSDKMTKEYKILYSFFKYLRDKKLKDSILKAIHVTFDL